MPSQPSMRERHRRQGEREIRDAAMQLFADLGYASTTVAEIAEAAGVSPRTFFRYFRSKEDVVVDAPVGYGAVLAAALTDRPAQESPGEAVTAALRLRTSRWQERPSDAQAVWRLLESSPDLAARMSGKTDEWHVALADALEGRLEPPAATRRLRARAVVGAVIAGLDAAFADWQQSPTTSLDDLFDTWVHLRAAEQQLDICWSARLGVPLRLRAGTHTLLTVQRVQTAGVRLPAASLPEGWHEFDADEDLAPD